MSIGQIIDNLGVDGYEPKDGELPAGAVVLLKVIDADGDVVFRCAWSDGMSWLERRGMIETARDAEVSVPPDYMDEDDE